MNMNESFVSEVKDNRNIIAPTSLGLPGTLKLFYLYPHTQNNFSYYNK